MAATKADSKVLHLTDQIRIVWILLKEGPKSENVVFTIFGFPRITVLFNFVLFWILMIRYGLCKEHLNTDRGEAARFQKLPTTIKRQYNTILPKSSSLS